MVLKFLLYGAERVSVCKKAIFWFYLPNLIFSIFLSFFISSRIDEILSQSLEGEKFLKNFTLSFFGYLSSIYPDFFTTAESLLMVFIPLFLLVYIFFSGGAIKVLSREGGNHDFNFFLTGCHEFFFRFLRLFLISIPFYLIPFLFIKTSLITHFEKVYEVEEIKLLISKIIVYISSFIFFSFINLVFDVTKIRIVVKNSRSALGEFIYTLIYVLRNLTPLMTLYFLTAFFNIVPFGLYTLISPYMLYSSSLFSFLLIFFISQLILLIRIWVKFVFWASQMELWVFYESRKI
ncbi:MAG: hypothetical protein ACUVUG_03330 [Candidatus Aminicenantia bacterium]